MTTTEKEVEMVKKHSKQLNIADLVTDDALDNALAKLKDSVNVYSRLAQVELDEEQGLNILKTLTQGKVISEKLREEIAKIWIAPTHNEDKGRNLYNLNNAVTQHLTRNVEDTRAELSERVSRNVFKRLYKGATQETELQKLLLPLRTVDVKSN